MNLHQISDHLKKIVVTGPESSGKTTLAKQLAEYFGTIWVPEHARDYLAEKGGSYEENDLLKIAKGQVLAEEALEKKATQLIICDTDLLVIKIWSEHKYNRCDPWILREIERRKYHFHLLCHYDIPWEYDPLREHPYGRDCLYEIYKKELNSYNFSYLEVKGSEIERLKNAVRHIEPMLRDR